MHTSKTDDWDFEGGKIYSLDRCMKCLGVLNLGQKTMCTVVLRRKEKKAKEAE